MRKDLASIQFGCSPAEFRQVGKSLWVSCFIPIKRMVLPREHTDLFPIWIAPFTRLFSWNEWSKQQLMQRRCSNMVASLITSTLFRLVPYLCWKVPPGLLGATFSTQRALTIQFHKDFLKCPSSLEFPPLVLSCIVPIPNCTINFSHLSPQLNYMSKKNRNYVVLLPILLSWPTLIP